MSCMEVLSIAFLTIAGFFSGLVVRDVWPDFLRFNYCPRHGWVYHTKQIHHESEL